MTSRDDTSKPDRAAKTDDPAHYQSPPESIAPAREVMREIREALTTDATGNFPARHADMDWAGMNLAPQKPPGRIWV